MITPSRTALTRCTLAISAAILIMYGSIANARDYQIEVVVFENYGGRDTNAGGLYYPKIPNNVRLGTEKAIAQGFLELEQGLKLTEDAAEIAAARSYRLLRHISWRQPGLADDEAVAIRVALGGSVQMYIPKDLRPFTDFYPGTISPTPESTEAIKTYTVNGTIKVRLGRFLHMDARLVYTDEKTNQSFRLSQSRKMRSGELHYIDNPRFGLLTRITPLDDVAGTATEEQSTERTAAATE